MKRHTNVVLKDDDAEVLDRVIRGLEFCGQNGMACRNHCPYSGEEHPHCIQSLNSDAAKFLKEYYYSTLIA